MDDKGTQHQQELALLIERFAEADGVHSTAIPLLHFIRASRKESLYIHCMSQPCASLLKDLS